MSQEYALVTVTYRGDLSLFHDLCASIDTHMPGIEHHVLVDRSDLELFEQFEGDKRRIIDCREFLPDYREFNLGQRRVWLRWPFTMVRGWIYQQLAKISYVQTLATDAAVIVDSDVIFTRPIETGDLFDGETVKMYRCPGKPSGPADQSPKWHNAAALALGMEPRGYTGADYISSAVIWSPAVLRQMARRIEETWRKPWDRVLTRFFRFSEYVLYGAFCDHIEGQHQDMIEGTDTELCHCSWSYDLKCEDGRRRFVDELQAHHRAVLIQSNLGMTDTQRMEIMRGFELPSKPTASA